MTGVRVREGQTSQPHCPWCRDSLETEATQACPGCGTTLHELCWDDARRCPTFGCSGRPEGLSEPGRTRPKRTRRRRPRLLGDEVVVLRRESHKPSRFLIYPPAFALWMMGLVILAAALEGALAGAFIAMLTTGIAIALGLVELFGAVKKEFIVRAPGVFERGAGGEQRILGWDEITWLSLRKHPDFEDPTRGRWVVSFGDTARRFEMDQRSHTSFFQLLWLLGAHLEDRRDQLALDIERGEPADPPGALGWD